VKLTIRCQDIAEQIDLGTIPPTLYGRFRFHLHLALCTACRNYMKLTQSLRKVIRASIGKAPDPAKVEKLNQDLLEKYSKDQ